MVHSLSRTLTYLLQIFSERPGIILENSARKITLSCLQDKPSSHSRVAINSQCKLLSRYPLSWRPVCCSPRSTRERSSSRDARLTIMTRRTCTCARAPPVCGMRFCILPTFIERALARSYARDFANQAFPYFSVQH